MKTNNLTWQVREYLESLGLKILFQEKDCIVADKLVFGQDRDTWIVWTVPQEIRPEDYESTLRSMIPAIKRNYPDAKCYVLSRTRSGFSRDFQQTLSESNIRWLVPVWFFDTAFKVEEAPRAASAITDIRSLEILQRRVAQPYRLEDASEEPAEGSDLFVTLLDKIEKSETPTVRVIVGRAGIGKTILFHALFAKSYEEFILAKGRHISKPRPIPLIPEHMKGIYALRTELLVENFLRTDVVSPVSRQTFEWLLTNGFTTWLLDGLDELYATDPHFFEYLGDLLTRKNSLAQVIICCRDSFLTTSDAFAEFRELFQGSTMLESYRLSDWDRSSKRTFAWISFEGTQPTVMAREPDRVSAFLQKIDSSPILRSLSGLPFYCHLLLQLFKDNRLQEFTDDVTMLNYVIDEMIKREEEKGLIDLRLLEPNGLQDWLEQIAVNFVESRRYSDIDRDEAMEYGRLIIQEGVDEKTQANLLLTLLQFPLFQEGTESGRIAFSHDLIAEVLAAGGYARRLRRDAENVANRLERVDLENPTLLRFIARKIGSEEEQSILDALRIGLLPGKSFGVLLSLLMLSRPERDLIKRSNCVLESRDLSGLHFIKRDLSNLSFRNSILSGAMFTDSDLRGARLEGAFLDRTRFLGSNQLENAKFGTAARVQSLFDGKKLLQDLSELSDWILAHTGVVDSSTRPCPTALQVQHLFRKFITPLGEPRRDDLRFDALCAGKHWEGATRIQECIKELVGQGYLTGPDSRERFRRVGGDKYAEMVRFVRDGSISDGLGQVIGHLCRLRGCLHQIQ